MSRNAWLIGAIAALLAVPVLAIGTAAVTIDPDDFKPRLVAAVEDATGRALTLNGPLRVRWSLWPTLQVNGASLANAPGGSRPDMARAERIEAQISLPALLFRRLEVLQLRLTGPNLLFEVAGGKANWIFEPPSPSPSGGAEPQRRSAFELRIRNIIVQNGMVTWHLPARTRVVGLRTFDLHHRRDGGPLDLSGTLVYGDNQPFDVRASASPTGGLHGPWNTVIDFSAFDTTAHAHGTMALAGDYDLDVTARSASVGRLNALLPEMGLPPIHGASLSAHIKNNAVLGSLPVIGPARLSFGDADLGRFLPGLMLFGSELSLPAAGESAVASAKGRYIKQDFVISGTFEVPRQPEARGSVKFDLAAKDGPAATLSLAGKLQLDSLRFAGLDAATSLRVAALASLRPVTSPLLPALSNVRLDGRIVIPADARALQFRNPSLVSEAGDLSGDGEIGFRADESMVQGKLKSSSLDLDELLQSFGIDLSAKAAPSGSVRVFPDTPLPWMTTSTKVAIDVAANIGTAHFQQQTWRDAAVRLRLDRGKQAASLSVAMPEGPAELSITADPTASSVPANLSLHAPGVPLSLLAHYAGLPGPVTGSARIEAKLRGSGRTVHELAGMLDGPFSLTVARGKLSNSALLKLAGGLLTPLSIKVPPEGETALGCFGLVGTADNGVLLLKKIALQSTYLSLDGVGRVDLGQENLSLKLHPLTEIGGSPVAVPVVVDGPFHAVTGRLDASGLDKIGLLLNGLFGGDSPDICSDAGLAPSRQDGTATEQAQGK